MLRAPSGDEQTCWRAEVLSPKLETADERTASALATLLPQLSSRGALTSSRIEAVLSSPSTLIIVADLDSRIVRIALLHLHDPHRTVRTGRGGRRR